MLWKGDFHGFGRAAEPLKGPSSTGRLIIELNDGMHSPDLNREHKIRVCEVRCDSGAYTKVIGKLTLISLPDVTKICLAQTVAQERTPASQKYVLH